MKDQATDKRSLIITGALVLTALFLVAFGWLLSRTVTCPEGWWLWHRLGCLEPNALGDTFAGAFAPVAFVWLVAAVLLQRNELAAQRQELRDSREVATQQVQEAKRNVEFIEAQTEILKENKKSQEQKDADDQFEEMLDVFVRAYSDLFLNFRIWIDSDSMEEKYESLNKYRIKAYLDGDSIEKIKKNLESISYLNFRLVVLSIPSETYCHFGIERLSKIHEILNYLVDYIEKLSIPARAKAAYIGILVGAKEVQEILDLLRQQGRGAEYSEIPPQQ